MRLTVDDLIEKLKALSDDDLGELPVTIGCDFGSEHWAALVSVREDKVVIR